MNFSGAAKIVMGLGFYHKMITPDLPENIDQYVVAGNARKQMSDFPDPFTLPEKTELNGKIIPIHSYPMLIVFGNSMSPEGIKNGDEVLLSSIKAHDAVFGDYIVIKVDPDFYQYRHEGKKPHFKSKLRKAMMMVSNNMSANDICAILAEHHNEYLSDAEKDDLEQSLEEARSFYRETPLFLSVTYHDGNIHYSLHPQSNIEYKVDIVARKVRKDVVFLSPNDLLN